MSLNAHALRLLAEKGLTAADIVELAEALEVRRDPTAAERMRRYRAKKERVTVTRNVTDEPAPNDIYLTPTIPQTANAVSPPFAQVVVSAWNTMAERSGAVPSRKLNTARQAHLRARVKENSEADVLQAIANVGGSKFHCGDNDRGWKINLGWMLKSSENFDKCMELAKPSATAPSGKQWTPEERAAHLAKLERFSLTDVQPPPPAANREASAFGTPIGQIARRIAGQA